MTTYKQNAATINVDTCVVSTETCVIGSGFLLESFKRIMCSSVACDILQRTLETDRVGLCDSTCLFALPAKERRTRKALFPQVKVASGACLRTVRNFLRNLTVAPVKSQATFAKRILGSIWGLNNRVRIPSGAAGFIQLVSA